MSRILILGAAGQVAQLVIKQLLAEQQHQLVLYLRHAERLASLTTQPQVTVIEGDVNDYPQWVNAMRNVDSVYANLGGQFEPMVKNIVRAMAETNVQRLIYISGLGLYHEVPGEFGRWNEQAVGHQVMEDTRDAARLIETSDLNYAILRCAYMTDAPITNYELTEKGTAFKGTIISRQSIATVVQKLIDNPNLGHRVSWGINQPNTDGDRPQYQ